MPPVFLVVLPRAKRIIEDVISREGGFVDHPLDPGGATNMGITTRTFERWRKAEADVQTLSHEEAIQIYYQKYWQPLHLEYIASSWAQEFIFDWHINAGRSSIREIQLLINVKADGIIGPVTGGAIDNYMNLPNGLNKIVDVRIKWYINLVENHPKLLVFLGGWFNRTTEFRYK